jgi:hypothetical protein
MDCNELLRRQLANRLVCQSQQIAIGPTGGTGPAGPPGPPSPSSIFAKSFTIFIDFAVGAGISAVYIPPGLFSSAASGNLSQGGRFTADVGSDLNFYGLDKITLNSTQFGFITGITASGFYASGYWNPVAGGNIGNTKLYYQITTDYSAVIGNVNLTLLTGGNSAVRPTGTSADGYLATITLFYL